MTTAGIFCPQCQVYHPHSDAPSSIPGYCPSCGCSLPEPAEKRPEGDGWFFAKDGKPAGPYSLTELRLLAAVGDLRPTDLLWKTGSGPNPSTVTARALLSGEGAGAAAAAQPTPPWAVEQPLRNSKFIPLNESSLPPLADLAAQPVRPPTKAWVAALIVGALLLGLIGVRTYVESTQPDGPGKKDVAEGTKDGRPKQAKVKGKGDPAGADKAAASAKDKEKESRPARAAADLLPRRLPEPPENMSFEPKPLPKPGSVAKPAPGVLAQIQSSAGWATFGQVLPRGAAREALKLGELPTQTDVKTRWPDGSIRFALVTARIPRTGVYPLRAGSPPTDAALAPTLPSLWVAFAAGADGKSEYTVSTADRAGGEVWLRGPLVYEERQTAVPRDANGTAHPFLRVLLDLRTYQDGQSRADITVENTLNVRGATAEQYSIWIGAVTGKVLHTRHIAYHPYLTRWRQTVSFGLQSAQVRPDLEPYFEARALPRFLASVAAQVNHASGDNFDPLGSGDLAPDMSAPDARPEVAPYPDWTARYLVHRDPRQARHVLLHGDLAGSWPIHLRRGDGGFPTADDTPRLSLEPGAKPAERPLGDLESRGALVPDVAQQPSLAYVPYLLTGDRYYADELAFWANYVLLAGKTQDPNGARGNGAALVTGHPVRGIAWGLRDLADAAAYLPDSHPLKKYFAQKVESTLRWLDRNAEENPSPLGTLWHDKVPENLAQQGKVCVTPWEQNYLAWAIDHANKQGFTGGLKHRDRIARFQLGLFASGGHYRRDFAAPEVLAIGERDAAGKIVPYRTTAELFRKNFAASPEKETPFAGAHGPAARLMLVIGLENGWAGAKEAHAFLWPKIGLELYSENLPDLGLRAGWALAPDAAPGKSMRR